MEIQFINLTETELEAATDIWNEVIEAGDSFPGEYVLTLAQARDMFAAQTEAVCALLNGKVVGAYILHPNISGRCAHISNASYAVKKDSRSQGIGRAMVSDCIRRAKEDGFHGLQFNAVVSSNKAAIALYLKLGFTVIGTIPGGYRLKDGSYTDTLIFLKTWPDESGDAQ